MFKGNHFFRDTCYFLILIFFVKAAIMHEQRKKNTLVYQSFDQASTSIITPQPAPTTNNALLSDYTKQELHLMTQRIHEEEPTIKKAQSLTTKSSKNQTYKQPDIFISKAKKLLTELDKLHIIVGKTDDIEIKEKNKLLADIKELYSQTKHYLHEYTKNPAETRFLLGPLGSSAQAIKESGLQKKLDRNYTKTKEILTSLT